MTTNTAENAYKYALAGQLDALKNLKKNGDCLTQHHHEFHPYFNAPAKLAFEGHHAAAELFLNCETGDVNDLIRGYSEAGNVERVQYWLARGGDYALAVRGLAFAGANEAVENIIIGSDDEEKTFNIIINAIEGYARAGNHDTVNHYLQNVFEDETQELEDAIRAAIKGYAKVPAYIDQANALIQNEEDQQAFYSELPYHVFREIFETTPIKHRHCAIVKAAEMGDDEFINNHLAQYCEDRIETDEALLETYNIVYFAFLCEGHHRAAAQFVERFRYNNEPFPKSRDTLYLDGLLDYKQLSAAAKHWLDFDEMDPSVCAENYAQDNANDYMERSTFGRLISRLSLDPKERTKQLLTIRDPDVRDRLIWLQNNSPYVETENTPEMETIMDIDTMLSFTSLRYDTVWMLQSIKNFKNAYNTLLVSTHQTAEPLKTPHIMNFILAYMLGISEESADIIREDLTDSIQRAKQPKEQPAKQSVEIKCLTPTPSRSSSPDLDSLDISSPYRSGSPVMFSPAPSRSPSPERPRSPSPTLRRVG